MVGVNSLRGCVVLSAVGVALLGCGGPARQMPPPKMEVRGSIAVADPEPRLILVGPARLLHLQIERKGPVHVFRAPRHDGTSADCRVVPPRGAVDGWPVKRAAIDISKDEVVCAKVERKARLSWHARPLPPGQTAIDPVRQASLP